MAPLEETVLAAARRIVREANKNDTLGELTKNKIRSQIETELELESGALQSLKRVISQAVDEAMLVEENEEVGPSAPIKRKRTSEDDNSKSTKKPRPKKGEFHDTAPNPEEPPPSPENTHAEKSESELSVLIDEPPKRRKSSKKSSGKKSEMPPKPQNDQIPKKDNAEKSESELSVLIDEEPKKKKKEKRTSQSGGSKKSKEPLSKNEEAIKKYKALVVACGVRKQWAKEFVDCTTESQQISRLRQILSDLGMKGRMSLEQAKVIREKRELHEEIADVISFESKRGVNAARSSRSRAISKSTTSKSPSNDAEDDSNEDSDEEKTHPKRKPTAARSILAFLGDQSDED